MPSSILQKSFSSSGNIISALVATPLAIVVLLAIWLAAASVTENMRFARATDQILGLIVVMRDHAVRDKNFATQPGEDALMVVGRAALVADVALNGTTAILANPWQGDLRAVTFGPSVVRLETEVPVRDCRRLALFFVKEAETLGFQAMEAREGMVGAWRRFFDGSQIPTLDSRPIEAACGRMPQTTLALVFRLR